MGPSLGLQRDAQKGNLISLRHEGVSEKDGYRKGGGSDTSGRLVNRSGQGAEPTGKLERNRPRTRDASQ